MLDHTWRKAHRSSQEGACVEVRAVDGAVEVRDSKDRSGTVLAFGTAEWTAFLAGARRGDFDR
ncbi:MAG: hypothetical protein QOH97_500 [Actinoplanes sp.]|nr:hypothetical protein [Actinoplanes sp.]